MSIQITLLIFHLLTILLLLLVIVSGDYLCRHAKVQVLRAVFDNVTHLLVGGLSWVIVCLIFNKRYSNTTHIEDVFLCAAASSLIDLDHFYAVGSLRLSDIRHIQGRPPLHCSTFPLATVIVVLFIAYERENEWVIKLALIFLIAFASHHIRDANRRGFWFYPIGSTLPISTFAYISATITLPYIISFLFWSLTFQIRPKLQSSDILIHVSIA